jgi:oxygen-dependent protoporphyrinogen oxidase
MSGAADVSDVIIVGGGIAGLAAAYELHRRNVPALVLEASGRAGGVILSEEIDGFTIDGGPDSLLVQKPDAIQLCDELGLRDRLIPTKPPRIASILRGSTLHPLPAASVLGVPTRVKPFVTSRLFSWPGKLRMGAEIFVPRRREDTDESIGAFMRRRFGREAATYLAEPLLAGIHAGDVDRLSVNSLFPRFTEAERLHGSLLKAFRREGNRTSADGAFRSLPGGLSELVRALVAALAHGSVRLHARVAGVDIDDNGPRVRLTGGECIRPRAVVLATPAFVTAEILRALDAEIARLAGEIPYASTATIVLAFSKAMVRGPLVGSGFVVPRVEDSRILAASWLSSKWPFRAPDDKVLLRTFAGGARDPAAIHLTDDELVKRSLDVLTPLAGISGKPILTRVYRWERASAQHEVGHLERIRAIDRALERHPWLHVTGSGFRGVGIPDCIADGRATAKRVDQWLHDHPTVP